MLGWMFVARKPPNCGRESHITADNDTGCIIFVQLYKGKERMAHNEFCKDYGNNPAKAMRCTKHWLNSGRAAIVDSGFASVHLARGFAEHGMTFDDWQCHNGHSKFPRHWLRSKAKERGHRTSCTSKLKVWNHEWELLAAVDCDKQPMSLFGNVGTTAMGTTLARNYYILRADGTRNVPQRAFEKWDIFASYKGDFNVVDMHNSKRQGPLSFRDTWKAHI
jgi:hypothetical protein